MALFKCSSIYDVFIAFKRGFFIPDVTLNADHSVSTKAKNIILLLFIQISFITLGSFTYYNNREFIESSSKMLTGGLNSTFKIGFILAFVGRLVFFGFRYKFWEIVKSLRSCDLLVRIESLNY
jgi:hypothetical protein